MLHVKSVKPIDFLALEVELSNGKTGVFSVQPYLVTPFFKELESPDYFSKVAVCFGGIGWPNGQDFGPDTIDEDLKELVSA